MIFTSKRVKILTLICSAVLPFMLIGCATPVQHKTPSGKVETTIKGVSKAQVKDAIVDEFINFGYTVTKSDDMVISLEHPVNDPMAQMFFGSRYDAIPNARVTLSLIQQKGAVRVIADCSLITNPGTGFEQKTDANRNVGTTKIQNRLDEIKARLEKRK